VKQLEDSAHSLIDHGNIALAQQQMLLAGIISRTIEQLSVVYGNALDKTFSQLSVAEQNTFKNLADQVNGLGNLEGKTFRDIQDSIYKTQGAANQLLDRVPFGSRYPIFYGVSVRDLTTEPAQRPADVEVLGFHLTDPRLDRKPPTIIIGSDTIPGDMISLQEDRILLQIPDPVKSRLGFGNNVCEPRRTFSIMINVYYGVDRGFWPVSWTSEKEMKFNANALPGAEIFNLKVSFNGNRTASPLVQHAFSARSGSVNMGCEQSTSASARFEFPSGAQEIQCSAGWVDTSNVGSSSQNCAVGGLVATGTGSMRGRDRDCVGGGLIPRICNCPGGGHGTLQISGSYKVPEARTDELNNVEVGNYALIGDGDVSASLPSDTTLQIKKVNISIARKECPTALDNVSINVSNPALQITQTSSTGLFQAKLWNGQLNLKKLTKAN
jgi:hypothetical protein